MNGCHGRTRCVTAPWMRSVGRNRVEPSRVRRPCHTIDASASLGSRPSPRPFVLAACSTGPGTSPGSSPAIVRRPERRALGQLRPRRREIEHKTGATDVVLRFEEGGGFVMPAFMATTVPHFTLYGDGTIVFRDPMLEVPPSQGSAFVMNPMRTAKMSEEQVQELLAYALGEGGLAGARANYTNDMVADASTATIFSIDAGGIKKDVSVYALGMEVPAGQPGAADGPARAAFQKLGQTLTSVDAGGTFPRPTSTCRAATADPARGARRGRPGHQGLAVAGRRGVGFRERCRPERDRPPAPDDDHRRARGARRDRR